MNLKLKQKSAITLTELLVASIIISIILAGIVGVDISMRRMYLGVNRNGIVAMRTSAIMLHLTKNIEQATGYGHQDISGSDPGIWLDDTANPTTIWIRKDVDSVSGNPNNTPYDFSDDTWFNYTHLSGSNMKLLFCQTGDTVTQCSTGDGTEELGTVYSFRPDFILDASNKNAYVEIEIVNRFDPNANVDLNENPEYKLIAHIVPPLHSY